MPSIACIPWSISQHHGQVPAQHGNSWFAGEQNGVLCSVSKQNLERDEPSNSEDLL